MQNFYANVGLNDYTKDTVFENVMTPIQALPFILFVRRSLGLTLVGQHVATDS